MSAAAHILLCLLITLPLAVAVTEYDRRRLKRPDGRRHAALVAASCLTMTIFTYIPMEYAGWRFSASGLAAAAVMASAVLLMTFLMKKGGTPVAPDLSSKICLVLLFSMMAYAETARSEFAKAGPPPSADCPER